MTNEIMDLQEQVQDGSIDIETLHNRCEELDLQLYEDILGPIGYNTCDRCGNYGYSETDFLWIDGFEWDEDNEDDLAILRGIDIEGIDYCAICWDCVEKLKEKGNG